MARSILISALTLLSTLAPSASGAVTEPRRPAPRNAPAEHRTVNTCPGIYQTPSIRYPPPPLVNHTSTNTSTNPWTPPPQTHLWSPYAITYSTRPSYLNLTNMQATHYPYFPVSTTWPAGSQLDVVSWSRNPASLTDSSVTTVFGYFKPVTPYTATWSYSSTGPLKAVSNLWSVLAWGVDDQGVDYRVDYETGYQVQGASASDAVGCVNVASRRLGGPSERTYKEIVAGLVRVGLENGDQGFVQLVGELAKMKGDSWGKGLVEVPCDEACMANADLVPQ